MQLLLERLPQLVGSPLSLNALRKDLQVAHKTVDKWLQIFERMYFIFRISPFGPAKIRAVKKEQKHYHYDWSVIPEEGLRFENLVASHLLKWVHFKQDTQAEDLEIRYFRNNRGEEVDFIIMKNKIPFYAIEVKTQNREVNKALRYFKRQFPEVKAIQVSLRGEDNYQNKDGIYVQSWKTLLKDFI